MNKGFKVVIAGPSGSGKTTLAKALAEYYGWVFVENSAGLIMSKQSKDILEHAFSYTGDWGQRKVINESHIKPEFGRRFQEHVLNARYELMNKYMLENCIFDRSALDPIVYYLNQVSHNDMPDDSEHFIHRCVAGLREVDLLLRIPLQNPEREIEDNNSRVANWYFQKKIDHLFDCAYELVALEHEKNPYLLGNHVIRVAKCPTWDWEIRLNWAIQNVDKMRSQRSLSGE